jgi:adenylosuccinate synthase
MGNLPKIPLSALLLFIIIGSVLNGCSPESSKPYDRALVITYAELTLLYEKEKMTEKAADSLYQISVKEFFTKRGYEQEKFREVIHDLSEYPEAWKMFLQDVTSAMDSIRNDAEKKAREAQSGNEDTVKNSTPLPRQ